MAHVKFSSIDDVKKRVDSEVVGLKDHSFHVGGIDVRRDLDEQLDDTKYGQTLFGYESLKWLLDQEGLLHKPKLVKWGRFKQSLRNDDMPGRDGNVIGFTDLNLNAHLYLSCIPRFYADSTDPKKNSLTWELKRKDSDDEINVYEDVMTPDERSHMSQRGFTETESFKSTVYHSTKAHFLLQSLQKDGLWNPITVTLGKNGELWNCRCHPGSIRSLVFSELDNDDFEIILWDCSDVFEDVPVLTAKELIEIYSVPMKRDIESGRLGLEEAKDSNITFLLTDKRIEIQSGYTNVPEFRPVLYAHAKKTHELFAGKPLSIYIGYDSRHGDLADVCKESLETAIYTYRNQLGPKPPAERQLLRALGDIKIEYLDVSKIPEYDREYADQSTEFTYSRFLIPYLEKYEGFSIFVDNDFIFKKSPLSLFYYLNYDDPVACVQYEDFTPLESKFNGEKNVAYPKKLWSSLMVFNNSHPDCKKLTPDTVNAATGKYLHQFEWAESVSRIPERYILTEGYDTEETKPRNIAVHYTRGGPWVDGMDTSNIDYLPLYEKHKTSLDKQ